MFCRHEALQGRARLYNPDKRGHKVPGQGRILEFYSIAVNPQKIIFKIGIYMIIFLIVGGIALIWTCTYLDNASRTSSCIGNSDI